MGKLTWATFLERVKKEYPRAQPDKLFNVIKTTYGNSAHESGYQVVRNSWAYIVVGSIAKKINTPKDKKKRTTRNIIRNWCRSKDYKEMWCLFHPIKIKNSKTKAVEWNSNNETNFNKIGLVRHVKQVNEVWVSKKGKKLRSHLTPSGNFPISGEVGQHFDKLSFGD